MLLLLLMLVVICCLECGGIDDWAARCPALTNIVDTSCGKPMHGEIVIIAMLMMVMMTTTQQQTLKRSGLEIGRVPQQARRKITEAIILCRRCCWRALCWLRYVQYH